MKKIFYFGVLGLGLFEILNVYFIMPMPGSQEMNSIDVAYFLFSFRWVFRVLFGGMIVAGAATVFRQKRKWIPALALAVALFIVYQFNFKMTADKMFRQPEKLVFKPRAGNVLADSTIVLGVEYNGEAKAYPIRYIVYHHQVQDVVGGKPMIITYCSVCRTGRVFEPLVKQQPEQFRLVGMDHFNAMFEDATTKSWWRQATGEAVAGKLKGEMLPELESVQSTLGKWFQQYPNAVVMQVDDASRSYYDSLGRYERGRSKGDLTRTDSLSWQKKSWVVGIALGSESKAYDWNKLKTDRVINDELAGTPLAIVLSEDNQSFGAFQRASKDDKITIRHDTLFSNNATFDFSGRPLSSPASVPLKRIKAYQEFWHSWQSFHPNTGKYE